MVRLGRKSISFLLVLCLMFTLITVVHPNIAKADTLVDSNFNNEVTGSVPAGYTVSETGGSVRIVEVPDVNNKSVFLNDTSTSSDVDLTRTFTAQTGTVTLECKFMQPVKRNSHKIIRFAQEGQSGPAVSIESYGGDITFRDSSGYTTLVDNYSENVWYALKIVADVQAQVADVYVDDVLKLSGVGFWKSVSHIDMLYSYTPDSTEGQHYLDDIKVYTGSAPTATPTPTSTPEPTPTPSSTIYQAEDASTYHCAVETEHSGYTGSGYVNYDNEVGSYIEWMIDVDQAGTYLIDFRYASGSSNNRPMEIKVNDQVADSSLDFYPTGAWTSWQNQRVNVWLNSGTNTLRATGVSSEGGPNVDKIDVSIVDTEPTPTPTSTPTPTPTPTATPEPTIPPQNGLIGFATYGSGTTGGEGGTEVTVSTADEFLDYIRRDGAYIIKVSGTIELPSNMHDVASNKSIIGIGSNAVIKTGGLNLSGVSNIIIQNITFTGASDDSICIQEQSHHIWVDHCSFTDGYDGLLDIKRQSSYITVSWNHFYNHRKTCLLGHSDSYTEDIGYLKVTYHHNWFDGTYSRHPRVRYGQAHVFNNYYVNNDYGIASTCDADVVVESCYFEGVKSPTHVGYGSSPDGDLVERNNIFENCTNAPETKGTAFDPSSYYDYSCDAAQDVPSIVMNGAGAGKMN